MIVIGLGIRERPRKKLARERMGIASHLLGRSGSDDLPALRPAELGVGLRAAARWEHAFVPDASGSGTTLYAARPGAEFRPRFGPGSAQQHRATGAAELSLPGLASLRRDVDQPRDLRAASALGVGPRTAAVAALL